MAEKKVILTMCNDNDNSVLTYILTLAPEDNNTSPIEKLLGLMCEGVDAWANWPRVHPDYSSSEKKAWKKKLACANYIIGEYLYKTYGSSDDNIPNEAAVLRLNKAAPCHVMLKLWDQDEGNVQCNNPLWQRLMEAIDGVLAKKGEYGADAYDSEDFGA